MKAALILEGHDVGGRFLSDGEKRKAVYIKGGRGWTDLATRCLSLWLCNNCSLRCTNFNQLSTCTFCLHILYFTVLQLPETKREERHLILNVSCDSNISNLRGKSTCFWENAFSVLLFSLDPHQRFFKAPIQHLLLEQWLLFQFRFIII